MPLARWIEPNNEESGTPAALAGVPKVAELVGQHQAKEVDPGQVDVKSHKAGLLTAS